MAKPTFYEFFAGGGMARAGLGEGWRCSFANDFDARKAAAYKANWGASHFRLGDIHALSADDLPGAADLAWASFPCQDLSLAGHGAGLSGKSSGAFWGFRAVVERLRAQRRAPKMLVIENVIGALTSNGGADFIELCRGLASLGYDVGALTVDAALFLPQSRPRLFIVCVQADRAPHADVAQAAPAAPFHSAALERVAARLPQDVKARWRWWALPPPAARNLRLEDIVEENPRDAPWRTDEETTRLIGMMSEPNRQKLADARAAGVRRVGTIYRRTRPDEHGAKIQRAEVRFDGIAGCLRTPGGGSSRQFIIVVEGARVRTRLLSGREAARLMGLPDDYVLPARYNEAYKLMGDGLAVPAVAFIRRHLLDRLIADPCPVLAAAE